MGSVPSLFQPADKTTGSVIRFEGKLPDGSSPAEQTAFATLLKEQQYYLESALGLVTKTLSGQSPSEWANPEAWRSASSNLPAPFCTVSGIEGYRFQQQIAGVQFPSTVMSKMAPWASQRELTAAFTGFLMTIGDQLRSGIRSASSMATYHLVLGYQPIRGEAGAWQLASTADCYFVSVGERDKSIVSSCASAERINIELQYRKGSVSLNWPNLSDARFKGDRDAWRQALDANSDDLTKAKNYFSGKAAPSS
jgi:hypothetical protein